MTFLHRAPAGIRQSLSSLSGATVRHRRSLRVTAAAVLAVTAVVTPVAVQAASAATPATTGSSAAQTAAAEDSFRALADAKQTAKQVSGHADLTQLKSAIDDLENNYSSDPAILTKLAGAADSAVVLAKASAAGNEAGAKIAQAAVAKAQAEAAAKAAAEAKAKAAAEAKAQAEAEAQAEASSASSSAPTVSVSVSPGSAQAIAQSMMASQYGWGDDQFQCLVSLWNRESGWSTTAGNPDGAYGIPQALPGSKMASAGADWQTSASTQIAWGLGYISGSYGSPCGAWTHSQSTGWY
ncbi:hypothetical protein [Humibacter albus]|uniref:aggregation-promoting factor C-terminal-like domain-containing protein n=1 Tax=Humibacter albus TaxID=427754 RepID=UPI0003B5DC87|nr:hypothetical protein [Humibacter albus]